MPKIFTAPNPLLRQISKPVIKLDKKALAVIRHLSAILGGGKPRGVGLSAIQIGKPLRIFCLYLPSSGNPDDEEKPILQRFIIHEILETSNALTLGPNQEKPLLEGCLSLPGVWGPVRRHEWVDVKYFTLNPKSYTLSERSERLSGFPARVFQHELDHLNGILFTDHSLKDNLPLYENQAENLVEISLR